MGFHTLSYLWRLNPATLQRFPQLTCSNKVKLLQLPIGCVTFTTDELNAAACTATAQATASTRAYAYDQN